MAKPHVDGELVHKVMDQFADQLAEDRQQEQHQEADTALRSDPYDEYWCLVTRKRNADGTASYRVETISDMPDILRLMNMQPIAAEGPSRKVAMRRMHWSYVLAMVQCRYGKMADPELRKRAARARFHVSDVVDK